MNWYAIFVEPGKEEFVQKHLKYYFDNKTLYSVVPKRKLIERKNGNYCTVIRKMFPGYVLVKTKMSNCIYTRIKSTPNIIKVLGNDGYFSTIDNKEIEPILRLISNNEIIDESQVYINASNIIVKSGPLKGMEGIIKTIDKRKKRAKILLNFMNKEKIIDVAIEIIEVV